MRYSRLAPIILLPLLATGASAPRSGWDRIRWGMTVAEAKLAYPNGDFEDVYYSRDHRLLGTELHVAQAAVGKRTPLADMIEPHSRVWIRFGYRDGRFGANSAKFLTRGSFDRAASRLIARYGKPVYGDETEKRCFEPDGSRIMTEHGGFDRVLSLCQGFAVFVDKRAGNAVYLERDSVEDDYRTVLTHLPFQLIRIEGLADCEECAATNAR